MNIFFENVDFSSSAGPYYFANKLKKYLVEFGHGVNNVQRPDVQLSFVFARGRHAHVPLIQRLDGIWYNSSMDWKDMNRPIIATYQVAEGVVFQSDWTRSLVEHYFGPHDNFKVINNGADFEFIERVEPAKHEIFDGKDSVWTCAGDWFYEDGKVRGHKRLDENIRYFLEHSGEKDILCVAGDTEHFNPSDLDQRIVLVGKLDITTLIALYKRSDYFIHLAKFDNCPNVVLDARACGCDIICSSLGGTKEIAGPEATVIEEDEWDFEPHDYNIPNKLDFSRKIKNIYDKDISMEFVAGEYLEFFKEFEK